MRVQSADTSPYSVPAKPYEFLLVIVWFSITVTGFRYDELILYPLALFFAFTFFQYSKVTLPLAVKCWPLFLIPIWAFLTSPFGEVPGTATRTAIQMILTMQVCVLVTVWLRPRQVLLAALVATGLSGVLSVFITSYHDGAMTGIFAHKNMLGAKMLILWSAALCVAFDPWMRLWVRGIAMGLALLAFALILASHSATALVLAVVIIFMIFCFNFFAGSGAQTPIDRAAIGLITLGVIAIAVPLYLSVATESPIAVLLNSLGKSSTLTGRTDLWEYAKGVISERPWLGHGAGGFWRYNENDLVRQIFAEFYKSPNQHFSFHNAFYEVGVHFGLIGVVLMIITLVWTYTRLFWQLIRRGGLPFMFFPCAGVVELVRAFVESELMRPFILAHAVIWIGAIYASKYSLFGADQPSRPQTLSRPAKPFHRMPAHYVK